MSNVLSEEQRQQVTALGRLGWPLRRIQQATGVRRETASTYLAAAGIAVRIYTGHLIWGRSVVRLVFAAFFFYLRPRGAQWDPVGHF